MYNCKMTIKYTIDPLSSERLNRLAGEFRALDVKIPTRALRDAGNRIGDKLKKLLQQPTSTWQHKPRMNKSVAVSNSTATIVISVNDEPYIYVSLGTRPHIIAAKNAKMLRFDRRTTPKTTPNSLTAGSGSKSGEMVFAKAVRHPGTRARNFHILAVKGVESSATKIIADEIEKELVKFQMLFS